MLIRPSTFTIAQYQAMWDKGELIINRDYQRNEDVWAPIARSFFIETLLLRYPIPKLYLFQRTSLKTKKTVLEVVDGQQRTQSIVDFLQGHIKVGKRCPLVESRGRTFDTLPDELKHQFLEYGVPCDVFVSATQREVRDVFRRMNSHTVSLNAEEKRHADFQGLFKWFIHEMAQTNGDALEAIGSLTEKQLVRMQDAKLLSDFCFAIVHGIQTTKPKDLDKLYETYDKSFSIEQELRGRITSALSFVIKNKELHNTSLMKPHVLLCLLLAISHAQEPASKLQGVFQRKKKLLIDTGVAIPNLTALAAALDTVQRRGPFKAFVASSESGGTNVKDKREVRFEWLSKALGPKLL